MDLNRMPSTSAGGPSSNSVPSTSKAGSAFNGGHVSRKEEHEETKKKEWQVNSLIIRRDPPTSFPRLPQVTDVYARSLALTKPDVVGPFFSYYGLQDVRRILRGGMVVFVGDSVTRSMYKDLVHMCQAPSLVYPFDLQKKGELRHENDMLVKGSKLQGRAASKGIDFEEIRLYLPQPTAEFSTLLSFAFTTRMFNSNIRETLEDEYFSPKSKFGFPAVLFMNSCLWDMVRYRKFRNFKDFEPDYEQDVNKFIRLFIKLSKKQSCLIFLSTLPVGRYASAAFIDDPTTAWGGQAQGTLWKYIGESNKVVRSVVRSFRKEGHPVGYLDLNTLCKNLDIEKQWLENDGTHWKPQAHRIFSYAILATIAKLTKAKVPSKLEFEPYLNACDDITRFDVCVKWQMADFLRKSGMKMDAVVDMWEAQKSGAAYVPVPPSAPDVLGLRNINMMSHLTLAPTIANVQRMEVDSPRDSPKTPSVVNTPTYVDLEDCEVRSDTVPNTPTDNLPLGADAESVWREEDKKLQAVENTMGSLQRGSLNFADEKDGGEPMDISHAQDNISFPKIQERIRIEKTTSVEATSQNTEKPQEGTPPVVDDSTNLWVSAFSPIEPNISAPAQKSSKDVEVGDKSPEIASRKATAAVENVETTPSKKTNQEMPINATDKAFPPKETNQAEHVGIKIILPVKQVDRPRPINSTGSTKELNLQKPINQANKPSTARETNQMKPVNPSEPTKKAEISKSNPANAVRVANPLAWIPEAKQKVPIGQKPALAAGDRPKKPNEPLPSKVKMSSAATGVVRAPLPEAVSSIKPVKPVPPLEIKKKVADVPAKNGTDKTVQKVVETKKVEESTPSPRKTPPPMFNLAAVPASEKPKETEKQTSVPSVASVKPFVEPRRNRESLKASSRDRRENQEPSSTGSKNGSRTRSRSRDRSERRRDKSRDRDRESERDRHRRRDDSRERRRDDSRERRRDDSRDRRGNDSRDRYDSRQKPRPPPEPKGRAPPPPPPGPPPPRRAPPPPPTPHSSKPTNHSQYSANAINQSKSYHGSYQQTVFNQANDIEDVEMEDAGAVGGSYDEQGTEGHYQQEFEYEGLRKPVYYDSDGRIESVNNVQEEDDSSFVEEMDEDLIAQQYDPDYGSHDVAPAPFETIFPVDEFPQKLYRQDNFVSHHQPMHQVNQTDPQNQYGSHNGFQREVAPVYQAPLNSAQLPHQDFFTEVYEQPYEEYRRQEAPQTWNAQPQGNGYQNVVHHSAVNPTRPYSAERRQGLFSPPPPQQGLFGETPRPYSAERRQGFFPPPSGQPLIGQAPDQQYATEESYYQPQHTQQYEQTSPRYAPTDRLRGQQQLQPQSNHQVYGERLPPQQAPHYDQNPYHNGSDQGASRGPHNGWTDY